MPEKMDDPAATEVEVGKAMREVERINRWLGGNKVVLDAVNRIKWPEEPVTIMDLGCGGGDILRLIADWAEKKHRQVRLIGVDMNPIMTRLASNQSLRYPDISFKTADVFDDALKEEAPQITMCSLFAHHFDKTDLIALLKRMHLLAGNVIIINDLHRHWLAYYSIKALTKIFLSPKMVQFDAPLSVARALTRKEWKEMMASAGLTQYSIRWRWAWRWEIIVEK